MVWVFNAIYVALLTIVSPWILWQRFRHGKYAAGYAEKFWGRVPARSGENPAIWLHAVSVGEVLLLKPIIARLRTQFPRHDLVLSVTTSTGLDVARKQYPDCLTSYGPLDLSWAVDAVIHRWKPSQIVLVELELWPNMLLRAARAHVPVIIINGRLSAKSFRGYSRIRPLFTWLLGKVAAIGAQNDEYADRFAALGVPRNRLTVTGNVKYDGLQTDRNNSQTLELARAFGINLTKPVWVVGSTQDPEEEIALRIVSRIRHEYPDLQLIIVPRHKERFDEVARLIESHGEILIRRSSVLADFSPVSPGAGGVRLLDTLGELAACWGLADIAFVGGSLGKRGGQNMIEPAAYAAAVCFGPNTQNFRQTTEALLNADAARVVFDETALEVQVRSWLVSPEERRRIGLRAQSFVLTQSGAVVATIALIGQCLTTPIHEHSQAA